jgi:hypothetical protein
MALTIADAELMMLPIHGEGAIIADPAIQQRVAFDTAMVHEYAALYADGHDLGRLVVFQTDEGWLLADGFHRAEAAFMAGISELPCAVYQGTRRDALLYATSCNLHGKPLTNADKRQRVETLLTDPEWAQWSDNSIAKHCGVAHSFVGMVRKSLEAVTREEAPSPSLDSESSEEMTGVSLDSESSDNGTAPTRRTYRNRYGQVRTMETGAIGQQAPAPPPEALVLAPEAAEVEETAPSWQQQVYTGDPEWYTPDEILAPVREVLGQIDVDPASCDAAQVRVQARTYYTLGDDGLTHPWRGTVFLNPPYNLPDVARFLGKLFEEIEAEHTTAAIVIVNSATSTAWFQRAFALANAVCFPSGKIKFLHATKNGLHPCAPQTILYYGDSTRDFCAVFAAIGVTTRVVVSKAAYAQLALERREAEAEAAALPVPADPDCPPFDPTIYILGKLCTAGHEWGSTGQTRLRINGRYCPLCNAATKKQARKDKKQAVGAATGEKATYGE